MTSVQGELRLVTDTPDEVSQVWIQAPKERLHGTGMVTTGRASEQVTNGVVSFNALPGAAVMVLLVNGIPSATVKLLIPDKANATLRECIEAVGLADDGTLSELEELALEVARIAAQIASADQLETWASETASAAAQAQTSKDEANNAANRASGHQSNAEQAETNAKQSETNAKQSETNANAAAGRASSAADNVRGELQVIADSASDSANSAAGSAAEAKTAETNAKTHEANSLSAAERAEFAAEETIQQVEGDFATRNYVDESKYFRGYASTSHTLDTMSGGIYHVASGAVATSLGLPRVAQGWLEVNVPAGSGNTRRVTFKPVVSGTRNTETWEISTAVPGRSLSSGKWERTEDNYIGALTSNDFYQNLPPGKYGALYPGTPASVDIPSGRPGALEIKTTNDNLKTARYSTNHPGGADKYYDYATATNQADNWNGSWYVSNLHRLRSSPIVLTQPSGDYTISNKAKYRPSHRLAFTCPTNVERIRIHVRANHYRLGKSYGGMTLRGMSVGKSTGSGGMNAQQAIDGSTNVVIPLDGSEWVSEWSTVFLSPGDTYLLSYSADWTTAPGTMQLLASTNWASSDPDAWSSTGSSSGWSRYSLSPLDIWIECLAPADVPVYSYFGTSLTMGMSSGDPVFMSYPQIHARNNGVFCAQTAAGGWAVVDATAQDPNVIGRFGEAGKSQKTFALWGGSNDVNAREATVAEVAAAIEVWSGHAKSKLGGSIYLQTSAGGQRYTGPDDEGWQNLHAMNEWLRHEGWHLENVDGILDMHNLFTADGEWWNQDGTFTASPTDGHFNTAGNKKYAMALSAAFAPPREIGKGALAAYMKGKGL